MTDLRTAAQQALEALERYQVKRQDFDRFADEITALRAALAEPEPCQYPDCVDNGPDGKCIRWLLDECSKSEDYKPQRPAEPQEPDGPERRCGGPRCDGTCCQPAQEPVAWMWEETATRSSTGIGGIDRKLLFCRPADEPWKRNITPLYTAPPQRKPLTDGEIYTAYITATNQTLRPQDERLALAFARAIERAHGIGDA